MEARRYFSLGLVLLCVVVFSGLAVSGKCLSERCDGEQAIPQWDFILFVIDWPQSFCMFFNASQSSHSHEGCIVPKNVTKWTMHGTWPTKLGTEGPTSCNNTWNFDPDEIKDLIPEMTTRWPGLKIGVPAASFWEHEWKKHGTCAASLPTLRGEHNYFGVSLKLIEKVDLFSVLSKAGIVPSDTKEYSYDDIMRAIQNGIGVDADLLCYQSTGNSYFRQYLMEVRICLNKTLQPMNCPETKWPLLKSAYEDPCSRKAPIALPVIKH